MMNLSGTFLKRRAAAIPEPPRPRPTRFSRWAGMGLGTALLVGATMAMLGCWPGGRNGTASATISDFGFRISDFGRDSGFRNSQFAIRNSQSGTASVPYTTLPPHHPVTAGPAPEATRPLAKGVVTGSVRDEVGDAPIAGVSVMFEPLDDPKRPLFWAKTGADGTFRRTGLPPGRYRVAGFADDYYLITAEKGVNLRQNPSVHGLTLKMGRGGTITGRLFQPAGRTPLVRASVDLSSVRRTPGGSERRSSRWQQTDEQGRFVFSKLPPGPYLLETRNERFAAVSQEVMAQRAKTVEVRLVAEPKLTGVIRGRVVDRETGKPVAGAMVYTASAKEVHPEPEIPRWSEPASLPQTRDSVCTSTNARGEYQIKPLADGTYHVGAAVVERYGERRNVVVQQDRITADVVIELPGESHRRLAGQLFQPDGTPLANQKALLVATRSRNGQTARASREVQTDAAGRFQFRHGGAGKYTLGVRAEDVGQVITHFTLTDDSPCEGLRLTLKPVPRGTLTGFVFQSDGTTPAAGVQVLPLTSEKRTELNWYAVGPYGTSSDWQMETAKDGSYCLSNLPAGTYTLCFSPWPLPRGRWDLPVEGRRPGGPTVRVNVSVEAGKETGLPPVALPPGGALTGTVRTRGGRPVVGALLRVYGTPADLPLGLRAGPVRTDAQGRYRLDGLAAGRYFVIVTAPGYRDARSREQGQVQVREGTTTYDVELQTMPGAAE